MNRPLVTLALTLALLLQGLASAWASAGMAVPDRPAPAREQSAMPCHAMAADHDAPGAAGADAGMDCCDDAQACAHCAGMCSASPAAPAAQAVLADYLAEHYASVLRTDAVLFANPLDLLRPPITILR